MWPYAKWTKDTGRLVWRRIVWGPTGVSNHNKDTTEFSLYTHPRHASVPDPGSRPRTLMSLATLN